MNCLIRWTILLGFVLVAVGPVAALSPEAQQTLAGMRAHLEETSAPLVAEPEPTSSPSSEGSGAMTSDPGISDTGTVAEPLPAEPVVLDRLVQLARGGDPQAQFQLGMLLEEGREVRRNKREAKKWLNWSAERGWGPAQLTLARRALARRNAVTAYAWAFVAASGEGNTEACRFDATTLRDQISATLSANRLQKGRDLGARLQRTVQEQAGKPLYGAAIPAPEPDPLPVYVPGQKLLAALGRLRVAIHGTKPPLQDWRPAGAVSSESVPEGGSARADGESATVAEPEAAPLAAVQAPAPRVEGSAVSADPVAQGDWDTVSPQSPVTDPTQTGSSDIDGQEPLNLQLREYEFQMPKDYRIIVE